MKYTVLVSTQALAQAEEAYAWLTHRTPQHAPLWFNGLLDAINSLEENPLRCPKLSKEDDPAESAHYLLYGDKKHAYQIIFDVVGDHVNVFEIRHAARQR
jgi:plasmid stabilization system protein ParE